MRSDIYRLRISNRECGQGRKIFQEKIKKSFEMPKERDILKMIWTNFRDSFRPRKIWGNPMGKDRFGNKYFEIPPDPSIGKRKASRYFEPPGKDELSNFDKEMPAEWEAWLRGRRDVPPTEDELFKNQTIAELKKTNAAELEAQHAPPGSLPKVEKMQEFPMYPEYEVRPGDVDKDKEKS